MPVLECRLMTNKRAIILYTWERFKMECLLKERNKIQCFSSEENWYKTVSLSFLLPSFFHSFSPPFLLFFFPFFLSRGIKLQILISLESKKWDPYFEPYGIKDYYLRRQRVWLSRLYNYFNRVKGMHGPAIELSGKFILSLIITSLTRYLKYGNKSTGPQTQCSVLPCMRIQQTQSGLCIILSGNSQKRSCSKLTGILAWTCLKDKDTIKKRKSSNYQELLGHPSFRTYTVQSWVRGLQARKVYRLLILSSRYLSFCFNYFFKWQLQGIKNKSKWKPKKQTLCFITLCTFPKLSIK